MPGAVFALLGASAFAKSTTLQGLRWMNLENLEGEMIRLLLVCLVLVIVAGCNQPEPLEFSKLQGPLLTKWEGEMKLTVKGPSSAVPKQNGLWVDNGFGWQGPFNPMRPVPFYAPNFRISVTDAPRGSLWNSLLSTTAPVGLLPTLTERQQRSDKPIESVGMVQVNTDKIIEVSMLQRTGDGMYWTGDSLICAYVDPLAIMRWHDDKTTDGSISIYENSDNVSEIFRSGDTINVRNKIPDLSDQPIKLPPECTVVIRGAPDMPYYYHWTMLFDPKPHIGSVVSATNPDLGVSIYNSSVSDEGTVVVRPTPNPYVVQLEITLGPVAHDDKQPLAIGLSEGVNLILSR